MAECIVGSGHHVYTWEDHWGRLPAGRAFGYTHGVCEDSKGRIFIHNMSTDAVAIFDPDGAFIGSWGEDFAEGAHGMHLVREAGEEYLFLADIARRKVYKTTLDGEVLLEIGVPLESGVYEKPENFVPTNVAVVPGGDIYVADGYGRSYVHRFSASGEYIQTWGGVGEQAGQLRCPHGIAIDTRGESPRVLVADRQNVRLQYFSLGGEFLSETAHDLRHPCHFDQRGQELLVPDLFGRVTIFGEGDELVTHLGDNPGVEGQPDYPNLPREQRVAGKFLSPHAAIWDRDGNIYVVEWVSDGRVTKLHRNS